jgi:hypothetical protein
VPSFLIVGTPGAGTAEVARLAASLPGVAVAPPTRLLRELYLPHHARFPLAAADVRPLLSDYAALPCCPDIDVADVCARLPVGRVFCVELLAAVVASLCPAAAVRGEATPGHLLWWRPLTRAMPDLRMVGVVRDPRAVGAVFQGEVDVLAEHWVLDQRQMRVMAQWLGPEHSLVLAYEDVIEDPLWALRQLARLLSVEEGEAVEQVAAVAVQAAATGAPAGAPRVLRPDDRDWIAGRCGAEARRWRYAVPRHAMLRWSEPERRRRARSLRAGLLSEREHIALLVL